jgi:glycosyltransferase involved in cell wall biosynthesis
MKYLVAVDNCFLDAPGGMGRVAWDIAVLMRDRGHDVGMVAARPRAGAEGPSLGAHHGMRIVHYSRPLLPAWHPLRARRAVQAARAATQQHFAGERWDVVHMHSPFTGAGVLAALGNQPRYVYTLHSPTVMEQEINWASQGRIGQLKMRLGRGALRRVERQVLQPCARIHTLSEFSRAKVEHFHGLGDRVRVVPYWRRPELQRHCSKLEARRRLGWPADEPLFLTVRKLGPRYGLDIAIRAIAPLAAAGRCAFVLAGDGPLREELRALVRSLGVGGRIRFAGRLDEAQLALAYQAADLFVLPTRALECFGLIIVEALAFGCPVLSTDAGAIPELMRDILPEFVVPAGDVAALRHKLERFLDGTLVAPPPAALEAHVDRCFDKHLIAAQLVSLLEGNGHDANGHA